MWLTFLSGSPKKLPSSEISHVPHPKIAHQGTDGFLFCHWLQLFLLSILRRRLMGLTLARVLGLEPVLCRSIPFVLSVDTTEGLASLNQSDLLLEPKKTSILTDSRLSLQQKCITLKRHFQVLQAIAALCLYWENTCPAKRSLHFSWG